MAADPENALNLPSDEDDVDLDLALQLLQAALELSSDDEDDVNSGQVLQSQNAASDPSSSDEEPDDIDVQFIQTAMTSLMIKMPEIYQALFEADDDEEDDEEEESDEENLLVDCEICTENKEKDQFFVNQNCKHAFCNDCIIQHVETRLQHSSTHSVVCPAVSCEEPIEFDSCKSIIPENVREKWDKLLCESSIHESQKFYCPFKDCSAMLLKDTNEVIVEAECPTCFRLFCARCSVPWHASLNCDEFQKLDVNERANEDLMLKKLAVENNWNRCPRCKYYVEKSQGCIHMTCRCGFQFCYACGATWTDTHGGCQPRQQ